MLLQSFSSESGMKKDELEQMFLKNIAKLDNLVKSLCRDLVILQKIDFTLRSYLTIIQELLVSSSWSRTSKQFAVLNFRRASKE